MRQSLTLLGALGEFLNQMHGGSCLTCSSPKLPDFCFPNGRPKRTRKRKHSSASDAGPAKKAKLDGGESTNENGTPLGTGDSLTEEGASDPVNDLPPMQEMEEIGGANPSWDTPAAVPTSSIRKPKVKLMNRKR